jgi:predicted enzyme related to lactoylglutathione lyase
MTRGLTALMFPTSDVAKSKEMFTRLLGVEPVFDEPFYVGWQIEGLSIGLDPSGKDRGMTGVTPVFEVDDIRETLAALLAAGATIVEDVQPVGGGNVIAMLSDPDGNMIGLGQTG